VRNEDIQYALARPGKELLHIGAYVENRRGRRVICVYLCSHLAGSLSRDGSASKTRGARTPEPFQRQERKQADNVRQEDDRDAQERHDVKKDCQREEG
jgi:hypothetical protein